jgi:type I restriction enzyme S subunit
MSHTPKHRNTPRLRFPEFKGAWNVPTLGEISDRIVKKVGTQSLETISISAGIGFVLQAKKFSRDISGEQYKNYIVLNKGDFSYNKGNSKKFPQGCVYKLTNFDRVAAPNVFFSFKFKSDYICDFYQGYFENNFHGEQLKKFITSGARSNGLLNISADDFFSIKLPTPADAKEQKKIAAFLKAVDAKIAAEQQRQALLQRYKKGVMQKLFTQTLRFTQDDGTPFPDWEEKRLGEIAKVFSGGTPTSTNRQYYNGCIPFIKSGEIGKTSTEQSINELALDQSSAKMIKRGDLLMALYGANSGETAISKIDGAINQAILCIQSKHNIVYTYFT